MGRVIEFGSVGIGTWAVTAGCSALWLLRKELRTNDGERVHRMYAHVRCTVLAFAPAPFPCPLKHIVILFATIANMPSRCYKASLFFEFLLSYCK